MSNENLINRLKYLPESIRKLVSLAGIIMVVIISFTVLNSIFSDGDELVVKMKIEEERIANERKLNELISSLPSGILVSFDGTDHCLQ